MLNVSQLKDVVEKSSVGNECHDCQKNPITFYDFKTFLIQFFKKKGIPAIADIQGIVAKRTTEVNRSVTTQKICFIRKKSCDDDGEEMIDYLLPTVNVEAIRRGNNLKDFKQKPLKMDLERATYLLSIADEFYDDEGEDAEEVKADLLGKFSPGEFQALREQIRVMKEVAELKKRQKKRGDRTKETRKTRGGPTKETAKKTGS